jgi:GLPGLI family protein
MKNIFLLFLVVLTCSAQELPKKSIYQINYEFVSDFNGNKIYTDYILLTSEVQSIYLTKKAYEKTINDNDSKVVKDTTNNKGNINNVVKIDSKNHFFYLYKNFIKDSLTFTNFVKNKSFRIKEQNLKLKWEFHEDEKTIGQIKCRKASTNFRGRNYIAWFTEEIPLYNGPFKFNGLPGLIIEIHDTEHKYTWIMKSMKKINGLSEIKEPDTNYKEIDIRTNVKFSDEDLIDLVNRNQSRLPKDAKSEGLTIKRANIELKYEWEE